MRFGPCAKFAPAASGHGIVEASIGLITPHQLIQVRLKLKISLNVLAVQTQPKFFGVIPLLLFPQKPPKFFGFLTLLLFPNREEIPFCLCYRCFACP